MTGARRAPPPRARRSFALAVVVACALPVAVAHAGGYGRPNQIGARAVGMGGGFAAIADDPSAVYHNPAGLAFPEETQILVDVEALSLDRRWHTFGGKDIPESTPLQIAPTVGASTRFAFGGERPSRVAVGVAGYPAYGGLISFNAADIQGSISDGNGHTAEGIRSSSLLLFEIAPALAYQVSDVLALGASLRVGIGSFSVVDAELQPAPFRADLSANGAGLGASFSAMLRPHPRLALGAIYRTTLSTTLNGNGTLAIAGGMPMPHDFTVGLTWPQSAGLGVQVRATGWLRLVAQADWTGWSSMQRLVVDLGSKTLTQAKPLGFSDTYTFHVGAEARFGRFMVRAGGSCDTGAIPDAYQRRENRDGIKYDATLGASVTLGRFRVDAFGDMLFAADKAFDNKPPAGEPGVYSARVLTFGAAGLVAF